MSKQKNKLNKLPVLRRTPRLTTVVKSYAENYIKPKSKNKPLDKTFSSLKFCALNVGGLRSKLKSEDLFEFIDDFDIIGLLEIKMDQVDADSIKTEFENFDIF